MFSLVFLEKHCTHMNRPVAVAQRLDAKRDVHGSERVEEGSGQTVALVNVWCIDFTDSVKRRMPNDEFSKWSPTDKVGDNGVQSIRVDDLFRMDNAREAFAEFKNRVKSKMPPSRCCATPVLDLTIGGHLLTDCTTSPIPSWAGAMHPLYSMERSKHAMELLQKIKPWDIVTASFTHGSRCSGVSVAGMLSGGRRQPRTNHTIVHDIIRMPRPLSRRTTALSSRNLGSIHTQRPPSSFSLLTTATNTRGSVLASVATQAALAANASIPYRSYVNYESDSSSTSSSTTANTASSTTTATTTSTATSTASAATGFRVRLQDDRNTEMVSRRGDARTLPILPSVVHRSRRPFTRRRRLVPVRERNEQGQQEPQYQEQKSVQGTRSMIDEDVSDDDIDVEVIIDSRCEETKEREPNIDHSPSVHHQDAYWDGSTARLALVEMGFSVSDAARALRETRGDIQRAVEGLLGL